MFNVTFSKKMNISPSPETLPTLAITERDKKIVDKVFQLHQSLRQLLEGPIDSKKRGKLLTVAKEYGSYLKANRAVIEKCFGDAPDVAGSVMRELARLEADAMKRAIKRAKE